MDLNQVFFSEFPADRWVGQRWLTRLWPEPLTAAEEMLGELPADAVITNRGAGPNLSDLDED